MYGYRSGDEGESQQQLMHSLGNSSTPGSQQKQQPLVVKQQVDKVARRKRVNDSQKEDNDNSKDKDDLLKDAAAPRPKKSQLKLLGPSSDSDENALPASNVSKSNALTVTQEEQQSESSDDGLFLDKLNSKTAPTKKTNNYPEDQISSTTTSHPG